MNKRNSFLLLFILVSQIVYSQNDSLMYKQSFSLNINDLFIKRIFITYSRPINSKKYLEIACGYKISNNTNANSGSIFSFSDPFWYYNNLTFRVGVKKYFHNNMFIGISSNFNYKFFNKIRFNHYKDYEGEMADEDYVISRNKIQIGGLIKVGIVNKKGKRFIIESYLGIGVLLSSEQESIDAIYDWNGNLISNNPESSSKIRYIPTVHLGISIGILK
jgi:hypothetical protein